MKYLFLARHGHHKQDRLTDQGCRQMQELAQSIKDILKDGSAYLISSSAQRAVESSRVIASALNLPAEFEELDYLYGFDFEGYPTCYVKSMAIIDERRTRADGLVVVSHAGIADVMAVYFMKKEFGREERISDPNLGEAIHIDLEKKIYQFIPSTPTQDNPTKNI